MPIRKNMTLNSPSFESDKKHFFVCGEGGGGRIYWLGELR